MKHLTLFLIRLRHFDFTINIYIVDTKHLLNYYAWDYITDVYTQVCNTPFINNTINYGYKKHFKPDSLIKGKIINNQIIIIP